MKPLFISYRRSDGPDTAQLLKMHFSNIFGEENVFLDVESMNPGEVFPDKLKNGVTEAKVVVVMIGMDWKGANPAVNRMMEEGDWVRKELELALSDKDKQIFPVFVKGATPDTAFKDLPTSLSELAGRNAAILREKEFRQDLLPLIPLIEPYLGLSDPLKDLPLDGKKYRFPPGSPFKGLKYFTEKDAKLFFGRGTEIRKLYNKIKDGGVLFLYGQSGSGKSSLLFAGLKSRMEFQGWEIVYFRREKGINLAEKLNEFVEQVNDKPERLVILDQVEEIFTNPDATISSETEALQLLSSVQNAGDKISLILSFRKEYLAEINKLFAGLEKAEMYLETLQTKGLLEAITGINKSIEGKDKYELEFAEDGKLPLPIAIAQSVIGDEESNAAPLLQILLSKMWEKVQDDHPRKFTNELLESVRSQNLAALIKDQVSAMEEKYKVEVENGLVLDILYYFTTARGTSDAHLEDEIQSNYDYPKIKDIIEELKNKFLLTEIIEKDEKQRIRLAHDSLAPLIRELFGQSTLAGQKAAKLLDSKRDDIEGGSAVEFSKPDLATIDAGKNGMRKWTEKERQVIENSRKLILQHDLELEEKNKQLEIALKEAKEQTLQARAKALAATARAKLQTDPTLALRLAEAACKITPVATTEAQAAFTDITGKNDILYCQRIVDELNGPIQSAAFSPDGKFILTGGGYKNARLLNLDGTLEQSFAGHTDGISSVAFAPDGKSVLTGSKDKTARLWNLDGTLKQSFVGHTDVIYSVAFAPGGKHILTGSEDKTARLWNLDGTLERVFEGHTDRVSSVIFSPDGESILTGSKDNTARLWDLDGRLQQSFEGHTGWVYSVAFSPDGKLILTGSWDKTAMLWNLNGTMERMFEEQNRRAICSVAFSPDGYSILTGNADNTASLWNLNGTLQASILGHVYAVVSVVFSPDGQFVLTGSEDTTARIWNVNSNTLRQTFGGHLDAVSSVAFSPDGKSILTGSADNTVGLWDLHGDVDFFKGHDDSVRSVAFSPDGKFIISGSSDCKALLWDLKGIIQGTFEGHTQPVNSVAFRPDGQSILTGSEDTTAILWNMDGSVNHIFEEQEAAINSVAFSPDGKSIILGGGHVILWSKNPCVIFPHYEKGEEDNLFLVSAVAFAPDGESILTGWKNMALVWNMDATVMEAFFGHSGPVMSVAFSPDGKSILTGSIDGSARLWKLDGSLKQSFEGHRGAVSSIAFSPVCSDDPVGGKYILTGSIDGSAKLWLCSFLEILDPANIRIPDVEQIKKYDIPEDIEWGKEW